MGGTGDLEEGGEEARGVYPLAPAHSLHVQFIAPSDWIGPSLRQVPILTARNSGNVPFLPLGKTFACRLHPSLHHLLPLPARSPFPPFGMPSPHFNADKGTPDLIRRGAAKEEN